MIIDSKYFLFIIFLIFCVHAANGQNIIKEKTEVSYGVAKQDSIIRFRKNTQYDSLGRVTYKHHFFYHGRESGLLIKEEKVFFDAANQTLTETLTDYPKGKEPKTQKLVTQYLRYKKKEENSDRISRQLYDEYGEIVKEDTLVYNNDSNLIERLNYDYRGNTSLFGHYYIYNKKGLQKRWLTYYKWTTINMKGEVAERRKKRRDYKYRYNKKGDLVTSCGKHYSNKYRQKIKYDKNGKILEDKTILKKRIKQPVSKEKPKGKKYRIDVDEKILRYSNGRLVQDVQIFNKKELKRTDITYQDSLVKEVKKYQNGILSESTVYEYNEELIKQKRTNNRYSKAGQIRYSLIRIYNEEGKAIKEEQFMGTKKLSTLVLEYDEKGNVIEQTLQANNKNIEKTTYIYKYY